MAAKSSTAKVASRGLTKAADSVKTAATTAAKAKVKTQAKKAGKESTAFSKTRPKTAAAAVCLPALAVAGLTPSGPLKHSAAARAQSRIGNVVARSLFATLQSAAAGGYGVAAVLARKSIVFGAASLAITSTTWLKSSRADK